MELVLLSKPFIISFGALVLLFLIFTKLYQRCPSNKILVVFGRVKGRQAVRCYHGGGKIIWPLIQGHAFLNLTPRTIHIPLKGALSHQNIRINVPSTFTVAIGHTTEIMNNAAVRLLELDTKGIESMAEEIIIGQLRLTVATLNIEEINQDRERFQEAITKNIDPELHKIGLTLLNVNITDISDESDYIDSIGKKAASTAVNQAKIDVAEQEKKGESGKALSEKDQRISVAAANAEAVQGENTSAAQIALTNAELAEKQAQAFERSQVAAQQAEVRIQKARAMAEMERLEAEQVVPEEIKKKKIEIEAEAQANAILVVKKAEALGIQKVLQAKAEGYKELINACGTDPQTASTMLLIEKLEQIVQCQVEAIKNIKIDKITVWDSGAKEGEGGSTTSNFISQFVKSLPALHDITSLTGLKLPKYLGQIKTEKEELTLK